VVIKPSLTQKERPHKACCRRGTHTVTLKDSRCGEHSFKMGVVCSIPGSALDRGLTKKEFSGKKVKMQGRAMGEGCTDKGKGRVEWGD